MQKQTTIRDSNLRRLVHDFDALADVLHHLIDKDRPPEIRPEDAPAEMAFTTEWQMVASGEEVHPG